MSKKPVPQGVGRLFQSALGPAKYGVAIFSIAALAGGCNSSTDVAEIANQTEATNHAVTPITPLAMGQNAASNSPLVGAWMGKAILNEQALLATADSLPQDQRQALIHEARTFVTTEMAIQFSPSGEMETALEMQPVGSQKIAGQTTGTWKIIEATDTQVVVETTNTNEAGASFTERTAFAVSVDGDRLVLQPQVSSALAGCEPLIYLDRQMVPAVNVARVPDGTMLR